ncbi:hypothetical protein C2845_PM05G02550 [Panicum miliaceum]|uniref:Uncharacterized protein n=1 Tax=Panicum miliaceum TaxID=4540 RepID=A0A3L6T5L0_PANMI|nr:hypothetical protein C2845_PM05G02550 [Panicum miliaceum]
MGYVTALNLSGFGLYSYGIDPVLFNLTSLTLLDLSINNFGDQSYEIPSVGFEKLALLTHLNLSAPTAAPTPSPRPAPAPTPAPGDPEFDPDHPFGYVDTWAISVMRELNEYLVRLGKPMVQPPLVENVAGYVYAIFRVAEVIKDLP